MTEPAWKLDALRTRFGEHLQENAPLAHYTTARLGGPADALLAVHDAGELETAILTAREDGIPCVILGGGSNVLVSDNGVRALVILNRAHNVHIHVDGAQSTILAETGANFSSIARQAALRGLSGLEWAAAIPGTLGGAVYGNAGAFGGNMQENLILAEILHPNGIKESWSCEQMGYGYRTSSLKRSHSGAVILTALLRVHQADPVEIKSRMEEITARRRSTQPPGASMGSMFKNPPGDHAGRLIEAAGLKGVRRGDAEISSVHANFFVNHGAATASDIHSLIRLAQNTVAEKFNTQLELEVELLGDWNNN